MSSRDDRILRTPLIRFDQDHLYLCRINVGWSGLEKQPRCMLWWGEVKREARQTGCPIFSGFRLKAIWEDAAVRTEYEHEKTNYDVISKALKESMIIDIKEIFITD